MLKQLNTKEEIYRICLFGADLDVGNMGCRALASSLVKLFNQTIPNCEITLLYGHNIPSIKNVRVSQDEIVKVRVINCRLSPKAHLYEHLFWILFLAVLHRFLPIKPFSRRIVKSNPWLKSIMRADFVGDINGGDSFSDIYGLSNFLNGIVPCIIAILLRKPIILLPQTYGPFNHYLSRKIARFIIRHANQIYSRDYDGINIVNTLLGENAKYRSVNFCPDVAFSLEPIRPAKISIAPPLQARNKGAVIGLNVSGLLYMGGYNRDNMFNLRFNYQDFILDLLSKLLEIPGTHILIIPHTFGDVPQNDQSACREVWLSAQKQSRNHVHLVDGKYDQNELKAIIGMCDFFIGSRMHACIAAISQCIPTVGIAYSHKFVGVFQTIGIGDMAIDAKNHTSEELCSACITCFKKRHEYTDKLQNVIPNISNQLETCFANLIAA